MANRSTPRRWRITAAAAAAASWLMPLATAPSAWAHESITVIGRSPGSAAAAGFGDVPLARAPLQLSIFGNGLLADLGVAQLGALPKLDASVADAYNAEGYFSSFAVRGFQLDNRYNLRRDGLPINGETAIALGNKERFELIKGTSGIQAGTSSPAGLVNLVVKRPGADRTTLTIDAREAGNAGLSVDVARRLSDTVAVRLNAAAERLDPLARNTRGERSMLALAADWRLTPASLLQLEVETSHQRQPSVAGYSLLGDRIPAVGEIDPRRNLNDQPWRQPVIFDGDTASLRWQQQLTPDWRLTLHAMRQRLVNQDRTAFPYGRVCLPGETPCTDLFDRFAADSSFTYWQYISDNERRTTDAAQLLVAGRMDTGPIQHSLEGGVLSSRHAGRFQDQVFDVAGTGRIDGSLVTQPAAGFTDANTNRNERSTELFVRDAMSFGNTWQLWAGLRTTRLDRQTQRTSVDGAGSLRPTGFQRTETTPWLALATQLTAKTLLYASWGRGLETDVAPNRPRYRNAGESLALRSRQVELGLKHGTESVEAALTLFAIGRDQSADVGSCDVDGSCARVLDGTARHRGIEASWLGQLGPWGWSLSTMLLDAERRGSSTPGLDGTRPVNVPRATLRAGLEWRAAAQLALQARVSAESDRTVLPGDESLHIAGWSTLDLGARWQHDGLGARWTWRLGVDNVTNRRGWKESPYQFGHVYLYPLAPRTWRASLSAAL